MSGCDVDVYNPVIDEDDTEVNGSEDEDEDENEKEKEEEEEEEEEEEVKPLYELTSDETHELSSFLAGLVETSELTDGLPDIYKVMVTARLDSYVEGLVSECGIDSGELGFRKISFLYPSVDQYGNQVMLSAMALWLGCIDGDAWYDVSPSDVCLMEHFTITSNAECPSIGYPFEAFVNGNMLVIMPDYIGFGNTSDMLHPYLNHEVCAINSVDAFKSGMQAFTDLSEGGLEKDWTLCVRGASQGGGNALAVHRYMDTVPGMAESCRFTHSYCAAGPYNPALTVDKYLESGETDHPVLFTLTLRSMRDSYPEILGRFDEDRMYSDKYLANKESLEGALLSKEQTASQLNSLFIRTLTDDYIGTKIIKVSDILSEEIMNVDSDLHKALKECLEMNNLLKDWTPIHPMTLFYSETDTVVPYDNAIAAYDSFGSDIVTLNKSISVDHGTSCAIWMLDLISK